MEMMSESSMAAGMLVGMFSGIFVFLFLPVGLTSEGKAEDPVQRPHGMTNLFYCF